MRAKFLYLTDTLTFIPIVLLQFEDIDKEFCNKAGFGTELKVIIKFHGRRAACLSGYSFSKKHGDNFSDQIHRFEMDGSIASLGEILDHVVNIQHLPDELNVEETRMTINSLNNRHFINADIREILDDYPNEHLRKVIYLKNRFAFGSHFTAIFNVSTHELLFECEEYERFRNNSVSSYLWIPLRESDLNEVLQVKSLDFKEFYIHP